jgi:hypothetical protein
MGWLIALAIVVLLAILPLGVSAKYDAAGPRAQLMVGFWRMDLYPAPAKEKKKKQPKKKTETDVKTQKAPQKKEDGGKLTDFLPLLETGLALLNDLRKKIRVKCLEAKIILAGDDPCDLATNYGRAWAAVGNLWPRLERIFVIKKRNIQVECDFAADQTQITARLDVTLTLGRLLYLLVRYGSRALKQYLNIKKGGAAV